VTALLDFEFSAFDWRAMELAVCLSKVRRCPSIEWGRTLLKRLVEVSVTLPSPSHKLTRLRSLVSLPSQYAGEKEAWDYFDQFITGFTDYGRLTDREIEAVPDLINLRILSNVIYFVGRAIAKEDDISRSGFSR
jgi:Ser/Thr protein kinase RdoA (MazF antagonist)